MTTTHAPYAIETSEDDNGLQHPTEALWTPLTNNPTHPDSAEKNGFHRHNELLITGLGQEDEPPDAFIALGHGHTWTDIHQAATTYMSRYYNWPDLYTDPDADTPLSESVRTPLPERQHVVFIRHPHPDHPCGCEWDGTWHIANVDLAEPSAIPVTVMHRPGADQ